MVKDIFSTTISKNIPSWKFGMTNLISFNLIVLVITLITFNAVSNPG